MTSPPTSRLVSLPYEIRTQIWHYAIPSETELHFCPCIDHPPRASESGTCICHQDNAPSLDTTANLVPSSTFEIPRAQPVSMSARLLDEACANTSPSPAFLHSPDDLLSSLPLTCRQIYEDTLPITQLQKHLALCGPACLVSLLSSLKPHQLAMISRITIAIDLRVFRPPPESGQRASFHDIWKCIYNTRIASDRAARKFYSAPQVERMNADIIEPALDFYPLEILCGRTFDRREREFTARWNRSTGDERIAELRRIVGNRSREGLPVPGRWRR
jgi:hypothetical protein